jgi:hypothetical protein
VTSPLLRFISGEFTSVESRKRLRETFKGLKQSEKLDRCLDEAEQVMSSPLRYWLGLPFNWFFGTKGRLKAVIMTILLAFFVPTVTIVAAARLLVDGDLEAFAAIVFAGVLMSLVMVTASFTSNLASGDDSDYYFFRAWLLIHYKGLGGIPQSVDNLETDLLGFVQQQDPNDYRRRIAPIRRWSTWFMTMGVCLITGTLVVDALGVFKAGSAMPLALFFGSMGLFVLGGLDMWYEEHRIPILNDPFHSNLPRRRYGNRAAVLDAGQLVSAYESTKVTALVRVSALSMEFLGAPFAWEPGAICGISYVVLAMYALALVFKGSSAFRSPQFMVGFVGIICLFAYLSTKSWRKVGLKRAVQTLRAYHRLAQMKTPREILTSDELIDDYYFGKEGGERELSEKHIAAKLIISVAGLFQRPAFMLPVDDPSTITTN